MSPRGGWSLLTLLTCALGFWQKAPCRVHPWDDEYQYTRACYTDVFALYYSEQLDTGARPYLDHPVEYPVVIGAAMAVAASGGGRGGPRVPGEHVARAERGGRGREDARLALGGRAGCPRRQAAAGARASTT